MTAARACGKGAWAITIHKSQGLTFDRAVIDAFGSSGITVVARRPVEGLAPHHAERVAPSDNWPDIIAAGNIGCMTQIGSATGIPVVHTVELLNWAYGGPRPTALDRRVSA